MKYAVLWMLYIGVQIYAYRWSKEADKESFEKDFARRNAFGVLEFETAQEALDYQARRAWTFKKPRFLSLGATAIFLFAMAWMWWGDLR